MQTIEIISPAPVPAINRLLSGPTTPSGSAHLLSARTSVLESPPPGRLQCATRSHPETRPAGLERRRRRTGLGTAVLLCTLAGCAVPPSNLLQVSSELERRTGTGLAESAPDQVSIPPTVSLLDGLDEKEAVAMALWNNAGFRETLADLGLSRADIVQVNMIPNPPLSVFVPIGPKPLEITARMPLDLLWLRPKRRAIALLEYERTAQRLVQSGLDLVRDVRIAYAELGLANRRVTVATQTVKVTEEIERLTAARVAAGDIGDLELTTACVDSLQAREQETRARQDVAAARERLGYLVGLPSTEWSVAIDAPVPLRPIQPDPLPLVDIALAARPDLHAAKLSVEAAGQRIGLARAEVFAIAAGVSAKDVGTDFLTGPILDVAVPIFNQNQGGVALATAAVEKAARQYIGVRDRIVWEVRNAHTRALQAQDSLRAWHEHILPPLEESVQRAEHAYAAGDVSFLFVLDTSRKLTDARGREAAAAAALHCAIAELERSVGYPLALNDAVPPGTVDATN